jgi:hypothetical protein
VFKGQVVANSAVPDVLAGTTAAAIRGLGTSFINFHTVDVTAGARWTLAGTNSLGSGSKVTISAVSRLTNGGSFDLTGAV